MLLLAPFGRSAATNWQQNTTRLEEVRTSQMEIQLLISRLKRHGNQMKEERCEQELKKKKEMKLA